MKRVMKFIAVLCAAFLFSPAVFAKSLCEMDPNMARCQKNQTEGTHVSRASFMEGYLPDDAMRIRGESIGQPCDEQGNIVSGKSLYRCRGATSRSTGLSYLVQAKRIFVVQGGKPTLYAEWDTKEKLVYLSPAGERYAAANGTSTALSVRAVAANPNTDCNSQSHAAVANRRAGLPCTTTSSVAVAAAKPPALPIQLPARDCSKLNLVERIKCESMTAAGK